MSAVKNTKVRDKNSASDSNKLSMRAAREAQNGAVAGAECNTVIEFKLEHHAA